MTAMVYNIFCFGFAYNHRSPQPPGIASGLNPSRLQFTEPWVVDI